VFAPAFVHEPDAAVCAAPFESVSVTATCSPAAGTKVPVPVSFDNVTVNDCDAPTSAVAEGEIEICARTVAAVHVFVASGPSPACASPVARVSETPPTATVVVAWIDVEPAVGELITTMHDPLALAVVQLLGPTNDADAPPEFVTEKLTTVPAGAFTDPEPEPSFTFTCPVSVCVAPIGFVALEGVTWTFASTNVFTASTELPFVPSVATVTDGPLMVIVAVACPVTLPADDDVNVIVH